MAYDQTERKQDSVFSKKVKAGKRRTYFFDVKSTRGNDFYLTITESLKHQNDDGYDRHKLFIYKEDFNKFVKGLNETVDFVKTELMPDFDFDAFNHEYPTDNLTTAPQTVKPPKENDLQAVNEESPKTVITDFIKKSFTDNEIDKW